MVPYRFPGFTRRRLPSGLEVIPAPVAGTPLVELELVLPAGATRDPADRPGLAALVAGLLDEGTSERSALEIASAIERIGGRLDAGTNWNVATAGVRVLAANLDEGLDLLAEIVRRPTFPEEEVERARRNRLTDLLRRRDSPGVLATDNLYRLIYGDTIYGRPLLGTPASVRCVRRDDLVGFYRRHYRLGEATLLAAGDLDPDRLEQSVAERFETAAADRPRPAAPETAPSPSVPERTRVRLRIVDRPGSAQTELRLGHAAVPRTHPDWDALARAQHPLRRQVHQPDQPDPAREARHHLRRLEPLRPASGDRPLRDQRGGLERGRGPGRPRGPGRAGAAAAGAGRQPTSWPTPRATCWGCFPTRCRRSTACSTT